MIYGENICFKYNKDYVLKNINFSIENGEIFGITGKTGSGKSTLANILGGLKKPDEGKIIINGKNIYEKNKNENIYSKIGFVFQQLENQLFNKTIYDDIAFSLRNQGISEDKIKKDITEISEFLNINDNVLESSPFYISGGEKRKCALACVLITKPEILILDEPTWGMHPYTAEKIINNIKRYHNKEKCTIIFISNTIDELAHLCDKLLILENGKMKILSSPKNIFKKCSNLDFSPPNTWQIASLINQAGYNIPKTPTTRELQESIWNLIKEKEAKK